MQKILEELWVVFWVVEQYRLNKKKTFCYFYFDSINVNILTFREVWIPKPSPWLRLCVRQRTFNAATIFQNCYNLLSKPEIVFSSFCNFQWSDSFCLKCHVNKQLCNKCGVHGENAPEEGPTVKLLPPTKPCSYWKSSMVKMLFCKIRVVLCDFSLWGYEKSKIYGKWFRI